MFLIVYQLPFAKLTGLLFKLVSLVLCYCGIGTSTFNVTLQDICAAVLMQHLSSVSDFFFLKPFETDDLITKYHKTTMTCKKKKIEFKVIIISIDIYYDIFNNELVFVKVAVR